MALKERVRNEWIHAYRAGRLDEIPGHALADVAERESRNQAPKPDRALVARKLREAQGGPAAEAAAESAESTEAAE